ncbi:MAG: HEAT repeat domain-containing protein [Prochloraceae cyanobacterium]
MGIYSELDRLDLISLIDYWQNVEPLEDREYAASYYSELAFLIVDRGEAGRLFLREQINNSNNEQLGAILYFFSSKKHPLPLNILLKYLEHKSDYVILNAIEGLRMQAEKKAKKEVLKLRFHESQYVRGAVLRYLSRLYSKEARSILIEALKDPGYIVRESAIDEIEELEIIDFIPYIRPLINDPHPHVRQAAATAIKYFENLND